MKIVEKKTSELVPYENNPRVNDNAVEAVAESIKQFGFKQPIVVDSQNVVVAGHTRLKAALQLGLDKVPCLVASDLTDEQIRAYRLADNRTNEFASWNLEKLVLELQELKDFDLQAFNFGELLSNEIDELEKIVEDEVSEVPPTSITQVGDIWQLGNHRLICGDCTDELTLYNLFNGKKCNCIVTDPPYNVNYEAKIASLNRTKGYNNKRVNDGVYVDIPNDNLSDVDFEKFLLQAFVNCAKYSADCASAYVFYSSSKVIPFLTAFQKAGFEYSQNLIWVKNGHTMSRYYYHYKHEPIIFGFKKSKDNKHRYFVDSRCEMTVMEDAGINPSKMSKSELVNYVKRMTSDTVETDILKEDRVQVCDVHPTMKPVKLIARLMRNSSKAGDIVLDPFGGSGTTLIAAEQLGRSCYMAELEPKYCDVIIKRWEQFTEQKAIKVGDS